MHIWTGGRPSEGARELAIALGAGRLRAQGPDINCGVVVNWGCSDIADRVKARRILNDPLAVQVASNKLAFFEAVGESARTPKWTTDRNTALEWRESGHTVVARTLLRASGGDGIVICENGVDIPYAPLYTIYVPKTHEYRVHLIKDLEWYENRDRYYKSIMFQRKVRRPGHEVTNWKVRNLENGFIYQLEEDVPQDVYLQAHKSFEKTDLDFGAVDVMWHQGRGKAYVLEINTAPGLEERTAKEYAEAIRRLIQ